ncbi:MAG TPA: response regulator transcription factor [Candidatus Obscuribacterales bacterium]
MAKILLIEDDPALGRMVKDWLTFEHHLVELSADGGEGWDRLQVYEYDLLIIDWDLPEKSGLEICREFRAQGGTTPILMLTGKRSISDKESGFDAGADDYLTKPFHTKELSARVRALIRRSERFLGNILKHKNLVLDPVARTVKRDGKDVDLLPKEFSLLEFLMRHPNQVFSAEALLSRVWSTDSDAGVDAITTCIKRLRKKIDVQGNPSVIRTVHGVGYRLD